MDHPPRPLIAIIGGGASGTLLAWALWQLEAGSRIIILDPSPRPAVGLAYSTLSPGHFLNVPVRSMSADVRDPDHFLHWVREHHDPHLSPAAFVPRAVYGRYLSDLWRQMSPEWLQTTVLFCRRNGGKLELGLKTGEVIRADQVVLATGNFGPAAVAPVSQDLTKSGRYHPSGWDNDLSDRIAPDASVAMIGTGLTSLDVLMRLRETGHRGRVVALSRHGWCPESHAVTEPAQSPVIPASTPASVSAFFRAFRNSLAQGTEWRSAVDALRPQINLLWASLNLTEKKRFRRHLQRRWDIVRHRVAPEVANFLAIEQAQGTFLCRRGDVIRLGLRGETVELEARTPDGLAIVSAEHVVNCTGPSRAYRQMRDSLPRTLLEDGMARETAFGGLECHENGALVDGAGQIQEDLFAIGPMRWGMLVETTAIPEIRQQAWDLALLLETRGKG
ncbi:FAD/NAD(P)-binding protein [Gluconobacter kanchanaburiensis]|uniref:Pyridine nucleotide-disulfide oxidoreductase n=1 Tax=Gluconobacter kanchanaburiensis NBRC 103587 TaxID=1307948 RepID=A0A511B966_9PROT|nr:FAD/NAD(P)-binding protein [Gluconobacter kanchanaburiensis]MBF0862110.1 hydroxyacylglutathione hydrolase [Gluconobacter kanchanaburiensis]GBR71205.1 hydroxyacylglutathione hydrolase [Gluconobacter kanchanaburiensis NBRC 103587]GEK96854.1 pyridine nucleotide-disulfide oxidoreductase [Gluconobacter kanchanaburiensis NBRC 103587]